MDIIDSFSMAQITDSQLKKCVLRGMSNLWYCCILARSAKIVSPSLTLYWILHRILIAISKHQVIISAWISKSVETSAFTTVHTSQCTEVRRAFLIHLQKWCLNKVFIRIKIARKFKFCVWMIISGNKSVKKGQKMPKKSHKLDL